MILKKRKVKIGRTPHAFQAVMKAVGEEIVCVQTHRALVDAFIQNTPKSNMRDRPAWWQIYDLRANLRRREDMLLQMYKGLVKHVDRRGDWDANRKALRMARMAGFKRGI